MKSKVKYIHLLVTILLAIAVFVCVAIINKEPDKLVTHTEKTYVDIDFKDGGYVSCISEVIIHDADNGSIEYISVPVDALLAFDIPDRYGDKMYTLSTSDVDHIIKWLESIQANDNEDVINEIIETLTKQWYEYTPT